MGETSFGFSSLYTAPEGKIEFILENRLTAEKKFKILISTPKIDNSLYVELNFNVSGKILISKYRN